MWYSFLLDKLILALRSVDEILVCDHSTAQFFHVILFVMPCKGIQTLTSVVVIQLVHEEVLFKIS